LASNSAAASTLPPAGPLASNSAAASVSANQAAFTRNDFAQILSPAAIEQVTETLACGQHPTCDQMIRVNLLTDEAFERILHGLSTLKRPLELYWPKCVALLQAESRLVRYGINGHRRVDVFWIVEHLFLEKVHRSKLDLLKSHTIQVFPDIRSPKQRQETILLTALLIGRDPDFFALASVSTVDVSRVGILTDSNKARLGHILSDGGEEETIERVNSIPHEALEEAVARLFQCPYLQSIWPGYVGLLDGRKDRAVCALLDLLDDDAETLIYDLFINTFPTVRKDHIAHKGVLITALVMGLTWTPPVSPPAAATPGTKPVAFSVFPCAPPRQSTGLLKSARPPSKAPGPQDKKPRGPLHCESLPGSDEDEDDVSDESGLSSDDASEGPLLRAPLAEAEHSPEAHHPASDTDDVEGSASHTVSPMYVGTKDCAYKSITHILLIHDHMLQQNQIGASNRRYGTTLIIMKHLNPTRLRKVCAHIFGALKTVHINPSFTSCLSTTYASSATALPEEGWNGHPEMGSHDFDETPEANTASEGMRTHLCGVLTTVHINPSFTFCSSTTICLVRNPGRFFSLERRSGDGHPRVKNRCLLRRRIHQGSCRPGIPRLVAAFQESFFRFGDCSKRSHCISLQSRPHAEATGEFAGWRRCPRAAWYKNGPRDWSGPRAV
jgi:hypothetical protein